MKGVYRLCDYLLYSKLHKLDHNQYASLSADFSPLGKGLIILSMLIGRVGLLGFMLALVGKEKPTHVKLPEARLLI